MGCKHVLVIRFESCDDDTAIDFAEIIKRMGGYMVDNLTVSYRPHSDSERIRFVEIR